VVKKHIKIRIFLLFVLELDNKCKFIQKKNIRVIKEMMFLAANFVGWIGGDFTCLPKGDSQKHFLCSL